MHPKLYNSVMSFEAENEEKRNRDKRGNIVKWYGAKCSEEVFYVGDSDLIDPYSGNPIYLPNENQSETVDSESVEEAGSAEDIIGTGNDEDKIITENDPLCVEDYETDGSTDDIDASLDPSIPYEDLLLANEIYERLMAEAASDEAKKRAQIEALIKENEETEENKDAYNAETGSYSGLYGKKPMSQSESDELKRIMSQNTSFNIDDIISQNQ